MLKQRVTVAVILIFIVILLLYFKCIYSLHMLTTLCLCYDIFSLATLHDSNHIKYQISMVFSCLMILINELLYLLYLLNPPMVLTILIISQTSDILQYFCGCCGKYYIGWVSPKKTYEGYIGGFITTLTLFSFYVEIWDIFLIYFFSITSSLLSSLFKRYLGIKDYSGLLYSHGGWLDRVDSLMLPCVIYYWYLK